MLVVALEVNPETEEEKRCIIPFAYSIEDMGGKRKGNYNIAGYPVARNKQGISGSKLWDTRYNTPLGKFNVYHLAGFRGKYVYVRAFFIYGRGKQKALKTGESIEIKVENHIDGNDGPLIFSIKLSI